LKNSLAVNLQQRLKILQNEIDNYNNQIKNLVKQEKDYWKQLEQIITKLVKEIINYFNIYFILIDEEIYIK
jgi:conjugal transfer/entry exclusion protein